jgi:hypothetical protein
VRREKEGEGWRRREKKEGGSFKKIKPGFLF